MTQDQLRFARVPASLLMNGEEVLVAVHPSLTYCLFRGIVLTVLLLPLPTWLLARYALPLVWLYLPPILVFSWYRYINRKFTLYAVTNQRLIRKVGILAAKSHFISVTKIQDVVIEQGLIGRFLGWGTTKILTGAFPALHKRATPGLPGMVWENIDHPYEIVRELREKLGLHT